MFPQFEALRTFLIELDAITEADAGRWRASLETPPPSEDGPSLALFVAKEMLERLEKIENREGLDRPRMEFLFSALESYCRKLGADTTWKIPSASTPGDIPGSEVMEKFSDREKGAILGLAGRGIRFADTVIKSTRVLVSKGTGHPVAVYAERIAAVLAEGGYDNLLLATAFNDALEAVNAGRPVPAANLLRSLFGVLEQTKLPTQIRDRIEYILDSDFLPYLASDAGSGVTLFPATGHVPTPDEFSGSDYEVLYV
ncbi:MAG: hypothetical protein ACYS8W_18030, partial [Planctomycetota bacterium]